MPKINIIDNVEIKDGRLRVISSLGREKRVFLEQGNLEEECAVYSLMMMLIVHNIIDEYDLIMSNNRASACVKQLRKQFLYNRRVRGYSLEVLQKKLLKAFGDKISVKIYTTNPNKDEHLCCGNLYLKIIKHLDSGWPVQIGFYIPNSKSGHSVVVVGYAEYAKYIRLFCLDPSWGMSCSAFWNNIIDINLDNSAEIMMDYEHMAERYVLVTEILLINEELDIVDSPLPF